MTHQRLPIRGPFQGVVSDLVAPQGPLTDFDDVLNFFVRKGRIQSRPKLATFISAAPVSNQYIRSFGSFKDANGLLHTFILVNYITGTTPAYMLTAGPTVNALAIPGLSAGQAGSSFPFAEAFTQSQVFFANGGYPLAYLDGSSAVQFAGNTPGTCRFLAVNANHLIQAYTIEPALGQTGSTFFPRRVRWSASGNPLEWNPANDFTAGVADLLDVPDEITGLSTLGRTTFIYRTNGITAMFPTGIGLAPFDFENYSVSPEGVGSIFPYALATYDNRTIFIANDDIYLFDATSFSKIGGPNRKKIFADLSSNQGVDNVWGRILPNWTLGFDFPCYILSIIGPNIAWGYTFDDGQWVRLSSSQGFLTAVRTVYTS
jgi:hypothetical protein